MTKIIFNKINDFEKRLDQLNAALSKNETDGKSTVLITNKLTTQNRASGIWNGLKVALLSLLRPFGYDQFSHVKIDNVVRALLIETTAHCKTCTMNDEVMNKLAKTLSLLNKNSKGKYSTLISKVALRMEHLYLPVINHKKTIPQETQKIASSKMLKKGITIAGGFATVTGLAFGLGKLIRGKN